MRLSVFTVSLPEWTPTEAVGHLAELGFDGVEWRVIDEPAYDGPPSFWMGNRCTWPLATLVEDAPEIRALCESAGLAIPNLGTYVSCLDAAAVERALRGAAAIGAPSIRVQVPPYDGSEPYLPTRDQALAGFDEVCRAAARHGVRALVEIHMHTIVPSASAAAAFCDRFDPACVGVIHDAGNMVFEGFENYRMGLEMLGPYLAHVHLKNARWSPTGTRDDGGTQWAAAFAPLTEGSVDVPRLLGTLAGAGYDGWLSFEDFSTARPLFERTRDNLDHVRSLLALGAPHPH